MQFENPHDTSSSSAEIERAASEIRELQKSCIATVSQVVVGLDKVVEQLMIALIAGGHVLMEGVPGTAKTTLCKTFATLLGTEFQRIQFTPDLLPSDVTGTYIFDRQKNVFELRKGPIFTNVLLADELNRAPAKTQSSLLEAMQESQVTIEGNTFELPQPFVVLATQNPVEQEGVYRLPEAQLDRFLLRVEVGYPNRADEVGMLDLHSAPVGSVDAITTTKNIQTLRSCIPKIHASQEIREYIVDLARASRNHPEILLGASPRASLYLMHAARSHAIVHGRTFITHQDIHSVIEPVLGHRLILQPEAEIEGRLATDVIQDLINLVPVNARTSRDAR